MRSCGWMTVWPEGMNASPLRMTPSRKYPLGQAKLMHTLPGDKGFLIYQSLEHFSGVAAHGDAGKHLPCRIYCKILFTADKRGLTLCAMPMASTRGR